MSVLAAPAVAPAPMTARAPYAPRATVVVLGRRIPAFQLFGILGWISAIGLACWLTGRQGWPLWVTGLLAALSIVTFVVLVAAVKLLTGEENIVYYHHEIAVAAISTLTLWLLGRPVLPYLDAVFMGLGLFLAWGRLGCFMVGCCHGRPCSWGVCYGPEHARAGFSRHLVGVRLFPIQLVEALIVAATVAAGAILIQRDVAPGTALAVYSIVYGLARFGLELFRGDVARPYWRGASEAQWTSFVILAALLALSGPGHVPGSGWLLAAVLAMAVVLAVGWATDTPRRRQLRPRHVAEIARLLEATAGAADVHVGQTSLGLRISGNTVRDGERTLDMFAFSENDQSLDERTARRLARVIARLRRAPTDGELTRGRPGVYHVVVAPAGR